MNSRSSLYFRHKLYTSIMSRIPTFRPSSKAVFSHAQHTVPCRSMIFPQGGILSPTKSSTSLSIPSNPRSHSSSSFSLAFAAFPATVFFSTGLFSCNARRSNPAGSPLADNTLVPFSSNTPPAFPSIFLFYNATILPNRDSHPQLWHILPHTSVHSNLFFAVFWTAHLLLSLVRHIDQSEPIEHSVYVGHSPDIAQSFRAVYHFSFNILQRQQH